MMSWSNHPGNEAPAPARRHAAWPAWGAVLVLLAATAAPADEPAHQHAGHPASRAEVSDGLGAGPLSIPDLTVLTQEGKEIRFYSDLVKDKVVAMNFIFTTCTTICPPMGANFAKLQRILGERGETAVQLISVSVDPAVDTPGRLKAWSEKFDAQPGWTLVTGNKPVVDQLLKSLRVFTPEKTDHSPIVLVGNDSRGEWTRVYGLAPPAELAQAIERMTGAIDAAPGARAEVRE